MKSFEHHNARSIREAVKLLNQYEGKARIIAGGTDLLDALRNKVFAEYPPAVINIKTINSLDYIRTDKTGLKIGALARLADIAGSPVVREEYKLIAEVSHSVATPLVRNMATIGGNLAQDVRCWFIDTLVTSAGPWSVYARAAGFAALWQETIGIIRYSALHLSPNLLEGVSPLPVPVSLPIPGRVLRVASLWVRQTSRLGSWHWTPGS
jgi:FAD binding domain in molybdopterin dehydrogenase